MNSDSSGASQAAQIAAHNLRIDHHTAVVLRAFENAGVRSVLLKGPSVTRWLYPADRTRPYMDRDLLVAPASRRAAVRVLTDLGFEPPFEEPAMPAWWREHAQAWCHPEAGTVDLHRSLPGVGVDDDVLWTVLAGDVEPMTVGGVPALVLSPPGRALHLALHAAQHGAGLGSATADLDRALAILDLETWGAAGKLAEKLRATAAFAAGLSLRPAGRTLASTLELPAGRPVEVALRASGGPPEALTVERLLAGSGIGDRCAIVWHKLLPPRTYMRYWRPSARRGRIHLLAAYVRRAAWVIGKSAPAFLAWLKARRQTSTIAGDEERGL